MRKLTILACLTMLAACDAPPTPKDWSLFVSFDNQDYFVAEKLTHSECMGMVYKVDRWTDGAANYRCEQVRA